MEEKSKLINQICQKQNFEKMLLNMKNMNKGENIRELLQKIEDKKTLMLH